MRQNVTAVLAGDFVSDLGSCPPRKLSLISWSHESVKDMTSAVEACILSLVIMFSWTTSSPADQVLSKWQVGVLAVVAGYIFKKTTFWGSVRRRPGIDEPLPQLAESTLCFGAGLAAAALTLRVFMPGVPLWSQGIGSCALMALVAVTIARLVTLVVMHEIEIKGLLRRRVAVVGTGPEAERITQALRDPRHSATYALVATFDSCGEVDGQIILSSSSYSHIGFDFLTYTESYSIDLIVLALPWQDAENIIKLTRSVQHVSADIVVPLEQNGLQPQSVTFADFTEAPLLTVMRRPFNDAKVFVKVVEDYLCATLALLLTWPIMLLAAAVIKLTDNGPVLFRQRRVGFHGKPFTVLKFRTMSLNHDDDGTRGTERNNPRITRIGGFLRRTSLDELPQLINVLRGEMSIVGPRPHVRNMLVDGKPYAAVAWQYAARHRIKPGITGWAQINGMRGGISSSGKACRGVELDLFYIANWSLSLDVVIMFRTITTGLVGRDVF